MDSSQTVNKVKHNGNGIRSDVMLNKLCFDFRNAKRACIDVFYRKLDDGTKKAEVQQIAQINDKDAEQTKRGHDVVSCNIESVVADAKILDTHQPLAGAPVQVNDDDSDRLVGISDIAHKDCATHSVKSTTRCDVAPSDSGGYSENLRNSSASPIVLFDDDDDLDDVPLSLRKKLVPLVARGDTSPNVFSVYNFTDVTVKNDPECKHEKPKFLRRSKRRRRKNYDSDDEVWSTQKKLLIMPVDKKSPKSRRKQKTWSNGDMSPFTLVPKRRRRKSVVAAGVELPDLGVALDAAGADIDDADAPDTLKTDEWNAPFNPINNGISAKISQLWSFDITGADLSTDYVPNYGPVTEHRHEQKTVVAEPTAQPNVSELVPQYVANDAPLYTTFSGSQETPPSSVDGFSSSDKEDQSTVSHDDEEETEVTDNGQWLNIDTKLARYIDGRCFNRLVNGVSVHVSAALLDDGMLDQISCERLRVVKLTKRDIKELQDHVRLEEIYHRRVRKGMLFPHRCEAERSVVSRLRRNVLDVVQRSAVEVAAKSRASSGRRGAAMKVSKTLARKRRSADADKLGKVASESDHTISSRHYTTAESAVNRRPEMYADEIAIYDDADCTDDIDMVSEYAAAMALAALFMSPELPVNSNRQSPLPHTSSCADDFCQTTEMHRLAEKGNSAVISKLSEHEHLTKDYDTRAAVRKPCVKLSSNTLVTNGCQLADNEKGGHLVSASRQRKPTSSAVDSSSAAKGTSTSLRRRDQNSQSTKAFCDHQPISSDGEKLHTAVARSAIKSDSQSSQKSASTRSVTKKSTETRSGKVFGTFDKSNVCGSTSNTRQRKRRSVSYHQESKSVADSHKQKAVVADFSPTCGSSNVESADHDDIIATVGTADLRASGESVLPLDGRINSTSASAVSSSSGDQALSQSSSLQTGKCSENAVSRSDGGFHGEELNIGLKLQKENPTPALSLPSRKLRTEIGIGRHDEAVGGKMTTAGRVVFADTKSASDVPKPSQTCASQRQSGKTDVAQVTSGIVIDSGITSSPVCNSKIVRPSFSNSDETVNTEAEDLFQFSDFTVLSPTSPAMEPEDIRSPSADFENDNCVEDIRSPSPCDPELSPVAAFPVIETSWDVKLSSPCEIQSPDCSEDEADVAAEQCNVCSQHGPVPIPLTIVETSKPARNYWRD